MKPWSTTVALIALGISLAGCIVEPGQSGPGYYAGRQPIYAVPPPVYAPRPVIVIRQPPPYYRPPQNGNGSHNRRPASGKPNRPPPGQ